LRFKERHRAVLNITKSTDILDHIYSLPEPEQQKAMEDIRAIERRAMTSQKPQPGLEKLMDYVSEKGVQKAICTRNFEAPVSHLLETFVPDHLFHPIMQVHSVPRTRTLTLQRTREFRPPKPSPAGILHIAGQWKLPSADNLIMVGDSVDDMTAGRRAGAATVLLVNEANRHLVEHPHTDLVIEKLDDLIEILDGGFVGRVVDLIE
jgi:phosphoglycolate phosphatase-like HAD superfamily hydrolase